MKTKTPLTAREIRGYMTPAEVAKKLGTTPRKVRELVKGPLDAYRFGARLRIHTDQLEKYVRRCAQ